MKFGQKPKFTEQLIMAAKMRASAQANLSAPQKAAQEAPTTKAQPEAPAEALEAVFTTEAPAAPAKSNTKTKKTSK